jgi:6-pyruvoyl-tetrahydropterin synthase
MNNSKKMIIENIDKEYENYPDLYEVKEKLKELYIKQYDMLNDNKKHYDLENSTEEELLEMVYLKMKSIFDSIAPGLFKEN